MKIIDKFRVGNLILLTIEPGIPDVVSDCVRIGGREYPFDIAYDIENTIGIKSDCEPEGDIIEFIEK